MRKLLLTLIFLMGCFILCYSQITVVPQTTTNVTLIGKISHTSAMQTSGLSRKLPTLDALKIVGDKDKNLYKKIRKEANNTYKSVGVRKMAWAGEEFSASLLYFKDRDKYLLTFQNSSYDYRNESFWLSVQTKTELHELIKAELGKKIKYKNMEIRLDNNVVLVLSINKKKISFNLWDGYWVNSYWYRRSKVNKLFGE